MTTPSEQEWRNEFRNLWKRYPRSQAENLQGLNSLIESFFSRKKREWEAAAYERGFKDGSKWNEVKESDIQSMVARARRETLEEVVKWVLANVKTIQDWGQFVDAGHLLNKLKEKK